MGHELLIMTSAVQHDTSIRGVPVLSLPGWRPACYAQHSISLPSWRMLAALVAFAPDVVHLVDETIITACAAVLCAALGVPTVFSHHTRIDIILQRYKPELAMWGVHTWLLAALQRHVAGSAAVHLVVGRDMDEQLAAAGGCADRRLWPVGTDTVGFSPTAADARVHAALARGEGGIDGDGGGDIVASKGGGDGSSRTGGVVSDGGTTDNTRVVLYVGRVAPEKSLELLPAVVAACNAASSSTVREGGSGGALPCTTTTYRFVVVGDGPFLPALRRLCAGLPVTFLGPVPHGPRLHALYASADAFYSPSCFETLGQVYLESMASGTPVVAAAAAGALEVVAHVSSGVGG